MSKINFENYPPLALVPSFKLGDWVKDKLSGAYGVVEAQCLTGDVKVHWASGEWTEEQVTDLLPSTAKHYLDAITQFAVNVLDMDINEFLGLVDDNDPISLATLSLLEAKLLEMAPVEVDGDYEAAWETVEETAKQLDAEPEAEEDDIFAAFGLEAEEAGKSVPSAPLADGMPADIAERLSPGITEGEPVSALTLSETASVENFAPPVGSADFSSQEAPTKKTRSRRKKGAPEVDYKCDADDCEGTNVPGSCKCPSTEVSEDPKPVNDAESPASGTAEAIAETATGTYETSGADSDHPNQHSEAGLIDPETGEVLEPSFILRKLGWIEMPMLGKTPTRQEVDAFEEKLDQVLDRILSHQEKTARYRAACEKRCAPYDSAAAFWNDQFVVPMAKMLAPHRLPVNKKGEYKSKTMTLASGCLKFTKSGGAFVHDPELVKAYIKEQGIEKFTNIGAKLEAVYSFNKLISALSKGALKDIPGTGIRETNHFAKVKVASPAALTATQEDEEEGEE